MRKEEKQEQDHRREVNMESEGVRQLMLGVTRLTIQERRDIDKDSAEIRQLEKEMGQMSIQILEIASTIGNTTGGIEGYKRKYSSQMKGRDEERIKRIKRRKRKRKRTTQV